MHAWLPLIVLSALTLGLYDVVRKDAVRGNDVVGVLLLSNIAGALAVLALFLWTGELPSAMVAAPKARLLIALKTLVVGSSWGCVYLAMRRMPLTLVAPVRATAPFWTLLAAIFLYGEAPGPLRAVGMAVMLIGFFVFRWTILATGAILILADYLYFRAIAVQGTPISVLSMLRRSSAIVAFALGALFFREAFLGRKAVALAVVLAGAILVALG